MDINTPASAEPTALNTVAIDGVKPLEASHDTFTLEDLKQMPVSFLEEVAALKAEQSEKEDGLQKTEAPVQTETPPEPIPDPAPILSVEEDPDKPKEPGLPNRVWVKSWNERDRKAAAMVQSGVAKDLSEALSILGSPVSTPQSATDPRDTAENEGDPKNSSSAQAEIEEMEASYVQYGKDAATLGKDLRTEEAEDLRSKQSEAFIRIRQLERLRDSLVRQETEASHSQLNSHEQALDVSKQEVISRNPAAADADTPLSKGMARLYKALSESDDPRMASPDAPMILYRMTAEIMGLDPDATIPAPLAAPLSAPSSKNATAAPVARPPQLPPLASGASRTLTPAAPKPEEALQAFKDMTLEDQEKAFELMAKMAA